MPFLKLESTVEFIKQRQPLIISSGMGLLLMIIVLILSITMSGSHDSKQIKLFSQQLQSDQKQALTQLNRIEHHIAQLSTQVEKIGISNKEIQHIHQQMLILQKNIDQLSQKTDKAYFQKAIAEENQKLIEKLNTIQTRLDPLKKHSATATTLSVHALPFQIAGIDIWNGQPMATIKIGTEFALMAVNDTRSGWTMINIDFDTARVIFKNTHNQYVQVKI